MSKSRYNISVKRKGDNNMKNKIIQETQPQEQEMVSLQLLDTQKPKKMTLRFLVSLKLLIMLI